MKEKEKVLTGLILFAVTLIVYAFSYSGEGAHFNYFVLLADAFLKGHLYVDQHPGWLNELVLWQGKYFVVYPPMPAVLLMPFVALFGISFKQPYLSILLGAVNVGISYFVFIKYFQSKQLAFIGSVLYAFGTMQWFHAEVGSAWYIAHIVALLFLWLMLLECLTKKRLFVIGLLIGLAYLSRLPTILSIVFVLVYLSDKFFAIKDKGIDINFRSFIYLGLGLLPGLAINALYNYSRFGVFKDYAYDLLPLLQEPWYNHGFLSIYYIPLRLKEVFFALPHFQSDPPFVIPSMYAMAIWIVTPAFLLIPLARFKEKLIFASLLAAVAVSIPSLDKGGNGFTQFGFRYFLDLLPFLLLMTISGMKGKIRWAIPLTLLSILINLWGVIMISHLNLWTF